MKPKILGLVAAVSLAGTMAANATPVSYAFSGTVYGDITGGSLQPPIGSLVTGRITIDLANGVASQSLLPVSKTSNWRIDEFSGPLVGIPTLNPNYVFSEVVKVAGFSYATNPTPGPYQSNSSVEGIPDATGNYIVGGPSGGNVYVATEYQVSSGDGQNFTESFLTLDNFHHVPWSGVGLPIFGGGTIAQGLFVSGVNGVESGVIYNIDSLHRIPGPGVPEPATLSLLALGLAGLGFASLRRAS